MCKLPYSKKCRVTITHVYLNRVLNDRTTQCIIIRIFTSNVKLHIYIQPVVQAMI